MEKISILIPVYNGEKTIEKCLNSVLNQTYKNIQIIVIDDGSCDRTRDILKKYDNVKVFYNKKNMGTGYTKEKLIKKCKTKYFMFVDSDDILEENAVLLLYNKAVMENADIVMGRIIDGFDKEYIYNDDNKYDLIFDNIDDYVFLQNKLFRKKIFQNIKFPNVSFAEDEYVIHKIINNAHKIVIIPNKTYNYTKNQNGLHTKYRDYYINSIEAFTDRYLLLKDTKYKKKAYQMLKNIIIYYYKVFYRGKNKVEISKIHKLFRKNLKMRYIRFRDLFFLFFPKLYCLIRNNIGE